MHQSVGQGGQNWKHDDWPLNPYASEASAQEAYLDGIEASILQLDSHYFVFWVMGKNKENSGEKHWA